MARRERRIAVYKPSKHGRRWRIEVRDGITGQKLRPSFNSEEEAWCEYHKAIEEAEKHQQPTVEELITLYQQHLIDKGNKPVSYNTTVYRLGRFFCQPGLKPHELTPKRMEALYGVQRESSAVDSHRNCLAETKSFCRWLVQRGHLTGNPVEHVKGTGRRKKGKPQLRAFEAKRFVDRALELSASGNDAALGGLLALFLSIRTKNICNLVVRDIDPDTRVLHVEDAKTPAGRRQLEIPDLLWPHIEARIKDRKPLDPVFPASSDSGFHRKEWVTRASKKICRELGLPEVGAHGLRGTHSSLSQEAGATSHLVARQLGHTDPRTTLECYTRPDVAERQIRDRVLRVLEGGRKDRQKKRAGESR